jgi:hypothetical protein
MEYAHNFDSYINMSSSKHIVLIYSLIERYVMETA